MKKARPATVDVVLEDLTRFHLKHSRGNRTAAAIEMGISVRTLRNWINKYQLAKEFPPAPPKKK